MKRIPRAFLAAWLLCLYLAICFAPAYRPGVGQVRDFRSFQAAGYLVIHQPGHLYDPAAQQAVQNALDPPGRGLLPFYHLPYEAVLYAPIALLTSRQGYMLSVVANLMLLLACVLAVPETFARVIPIWQPRPGLAVFLFLPIYWTILLGQDSLFLLLICCLTLRSLNRGHDVRAGAILALALFKFEIALPLLALLAVRRGWRVLAGFLPAAAILLGASAVLIGRQGAADLRALLAAGSLARNAGASAQSALAIHPAAMPNVMGLAFATAGHVLSSRVLFLVVLTLSAITIAWGAVAVRRAGSQEQAFSLALVCAVLVSYHLYLHDASLLLIPICTWGARRSAQVLFAIPMLLILLGPAYLYLMAMPTLWLFVDASRMPRRPPLASGGATA